jgi:hypothetical protein
MVFAAGGAGLVLAVVALLYYRRKRAPVNSSKIDVKSPPKPEVLPPSAGMPGSPAALRQASSHRVINLLEESDNAKKFEPDKSRREEPHPKNLTCGTRRVEAHPHAHPHALAHALVWTLGT